MYIFSNVKTEIVGTYSLITSIIEIILSISTFISILFLPRLLSKLKIHFIVFYRYFNNVLMPYLILIGIIITIVMIFFGFIIINYFKNYPYIFNFIMF